MVSPLKDKVFFLNTALVWYHHQTLQKRESYFFPVYFCFAFLSKEQYPNTVNTFWKTKSHYSNHTARWMPEIQVCPYMAHFCRFCSPCKGLLLLIHVLKNLLRNAFFPYCHLCWDSKFIQDLCYLLVSETVFQCDTTSVKWNLNKKIWLFFSSHVVAWGRNWLAVMSKAHPSSSAYGWGGTSAQWWQPRGQIYIFEHSFHHSLALDNWELVLMRASESNICPTPKTLA